PSLQTLVIDRLRNFFLSKQVFEKGSYHSDLQPGNILVDEATGGVWLLDFGQVGRLNESQRGQIKRFVFSCIDGNPKSIVNELEKMGSPSSSYEGNLLVSEIGSILTAWDHDMSHLAPVVTKVFRSCHDRGLEIDLDYLQLLKGIATFEA